MAFDGEGRQELGDFSGAHLRRVSLAMEHDITTDPVDVRLLGPTTVVTGANRVTHSIEQFRSGSVGR